MKKLKPANHPATFILSLLLLLVFSNAYALDIQYSNQTPGGCLLPEKAIILSGPIHRGDKEKVADWLRQNTEYLLEHSPAFVPDSSGGSVSEAIGIAETFEQILASVWLPEQCENPAQAARPKCSGSCLALLVGAVNRLLTADAIGLNRPAFDRSEFAKLDLDAAKRQYQKDLESYITWLKQKQVAGSMIEKILAHSSDDVYWLGEQYGASLPEISPQFEQLITSKCDYQNDLLTRWADAYAEGQFKEAKLLREKWDKQGKCVGMIRDDAREKWALR